MPVNFSPPTAAPVSIGDQYRLYKTSSTTPPPPPVPAVDDKHEEVKEQVNDAEKEADERQEQEPPAKKSRGPTPEEECKNDSQADGEESAGVEDPKNGTGCETAAVSGEGTQVKPEVGDKVGGVSPVGEPSGTEPKTEEGSSTSEV